MKNVLFTLFLLLISNLFVTSHHVFTLTGRVVNDYGEGIAGVVVNDGVNFTTTDNDGRWTLTTDSVDSKFVAISTPAGYQLPNDAGLARFYIPVGEAVYQDENVFVLTKRTQHTRRFSYIAIGDPQVLNKSDLSRWRSETVKDIRRTVDSLRRRGEVIGMTLGDLVFDQQQLFDVYAASCREMGMTVFQTIGNHDMNHRFADRNHGDAQGAGYAEMNYEAIFGPTDYSFNIGRVHVVTMKNIDYRNKWSYAEAMSDRQLAWLERDLSYVPKGSTVFLNIHAPAWNKVSRAGNMAGADRLAAVLKDYVVHVFCGHTHFHQNVMVSDHLYQHNVGTACGAWWAGQVAQDGTPNGYLIVDVDGSKVRWHYKPTAGSTSEQMCLYPPRAFRKSPGYLVANVWDYDPQCRVEWYEDGKPRGAMTRFISLDERFLREKLPRLGNEPNRLTGHLFRCHPAPGTRTVTVVFTNHFGEKYNERISL